VLSISHDTAPHSGTGDRVAVKVSGVPTAAGLALDATLTDVGQPGEGRFATSGTTTMSSTLNQLDSFAPAKDSVVCEPVAVNWSTNCVYPNDVGKWPDNSTPLP
jgi:hypothetical protein